MEIFKPDINLNWVGNMPRLVTASALAVLASVVAILVFGLNYGTDFAGGYQIHVKFPTKVTENQIREAIEPLRLGDARVQRFGTEAQNEQLIFVRRHGTITDEQKKRLQADFEALAGGGQDLKNWAVAESGENVMIEFAKPVSEDAVRSVFAKYGLDIKRITRSEREDEPEYSIDLVSLADKVERALVSRLEIPKDTDVVQSIEFVGPQVGEQLRNQGFMAVLISLFFMLLYVAVRFDFYFAPGAIVALIHDVTITAGVYALFQIEFDLTSVAAFLTILGFSINDTIVVYDRIRENLGKLRGRERHQLVNDSINQTLSRTILTSTTVLMVVAALIIFGGPTIRGLAIALAVGFTVGTYSSIGIASYLYVLLKDRAERRAHRTSAAATAA